jgi:hypothetical protein
MGTTSPTPPKPATQGGTMNRTRVIALMTLAIFVILGSLMVLFFDGLPPWPVTICFAVSHLTFCLIVAKVRPYTGPYRTPLVDPDPSDWAE